MTYKVAILLGRFRLNKCTKALNDIYKSIMMVIIIKILP